MVDAISTEIALRSAEMPDGVWTSVYFGGGTPSLLSAAQIQQLLDTAKESRPLADEAEITLEANPDDLSELWLEACAKTQINRLSIGVQSFREIDLRYMNRAHNASQALEAIALSQAAGFSRLTIDLIYGTPGMNDSAWRQNLQQAIELAIPHISAYALTVEDRTALAHQIKTGKSQPVDEEQSARQMEILIDTLTSAGYEHYEISNFALPAQRALHNSNYWRGEAYLGVGPSAHSFDGNRQRSWNVANNTQYIKALQENCLPIEREILSDAERYNELILTRLRTVWGLRLREIDALGYANHFLREVESLIAQAYVEREGDLFRLTRRGRMMADGLSERLFVI